VVKFVFSGNFLTKFGGTIYLAQENLTVFFCDHKISRLSIHNQKYFCVNSMIAKQIREQVSSSGVQFHNQRQKIFIRKLKLARSNRDLIGTISQGTKVSNYSPRSVLKEESLSPQVQSPPKILNLALNHRHPNLAMKKTMIR
jgi:hypothetical protein